MNSAKQLFLRPPPNVEFVQGYPGIPPGAPDRPQAAIKGSFELRLGPQGIKAKYVRIELRKIETLPGGGAQNTFFDYVGPSPITLWQSGEDFAVLTSGDIPFYIRIPESIAPSLALEKGAGVKYELVGQVCIQGKTNFLRRSKPVVYSTSAPIIIDKHELHSTWPIYQQPESRHLSQDAVSLTVDRSQNCYGPGDRVSVIATIKSDSMSTVILRGFEFTLKETTIFRAGPHGMGGKRGAPQVKINIIGEQKVPVNKTIYGGNTHKSELSCTIPQSHTTTTLTSARHIDITYVLGVKALMGTGKPLIMELPVMVSNWPRYVSVEAIRRIGHAASLCLSPVLSISPQPGHTGHRPTSSQQIAPHTIGTSRIPDPVEYISGRQSSTVPNHAAVNGFNTSYSHGGNGGSLGRAGEFGELPGARPGSAGTGAQYRPGTAGSTNIGGNVRPGTTGSTPGLGQPITNDPNDYGFGSGFGSGSAAGGSAAAGSRTARPRASTLAGQQNRLTIVNAAEDEIPEESSQGSTRSPRVNGAQTQSQSQSGRTRVWLSAEEEKARLYQQAKADVERVQGGGALDRTGTGTPPTSAQHPPSTPPAAKPSTKPSPRWPTAEEEKIRLYNEAQKNARILQGLEPPSGSSSSPPPNSGSRSSGHGRGDSKDSSTNKSYSSPGRTPVPVVSAGAKLYQNAVSDMSKNTPSTPPVSKSTAVAASTSPQMIVHSPKPKAAKHFPSAEEEKEMLRRYHDAKSAVSKHHQAYFGDLDGVMPSGSGQAPVTEVPSVGGSAGEDLPPPWVPSSAYPQVDDLSEKDRYRQALEATERARAAAAAMEMEMGYGMEGGSGSTPPPPVDAGPPPAFSSGSEVLTAQEEKEMLRQKFAAQDVIAKPTNSPPPPAIAGNTPPPQTGAAALPSPPPSSELPPHLRGRAQPSLPIPQGAKRPLTAAEEKAMLRAKFEAEDGGAPSSQHPGSDSSSGTHTVSSDSNTPLTPPLHALSRPGVAPPMAPPPLAPRPPAEYIEETREEDAKLRRALSFHEQEPDVATFGMGRGTGMMMMMQNGARDEDDTFGLKIRPTSPFTLGVDDLMNGIGGRKTPFGGHGQANGIASPPPLPPKVQIRD